MIVRIIIAIAIAVLGVLYQSWWGLVAVVPIATAFMRFCGLYAIFGLNTCSTKK